MKTKLIIAFLMISCITYAQKKNQIKSNNQNAKKVNAYIKIDDIKGETNDKSSKRATPFIKIGDIKGETNDKSSRKVYNKRKFSNKPLEEKTTTRRRVVVAKSNKQGETK